MDLGRCVAVSLAALGVAGLHVAAQAQDVREFSFGYDQPKSTAYGFAGDLFEEQIAACSNGSMKINQFPGAQLGQEPALLEKMRAGDIDFIITSSANGATVSPELGVMSLHFLFEDEDHLAKAVASPELNDAIKQMVEDTVEGGHVLTVMTMGFRNIYSKDEVHSVDDLNGKKIRVQATKTEDTHFPAYGAQPVHMPFGEVYTSIQTGVVDMAENGVNVFLSNKHYEVAPVMSFTQHEANNNLVWVSDKTWESLNDEQQQCVTAAAAEIGKQEPAHALQLEQDSAEKLKEIGVLIVDDVDKSGFIAAAQPIQDKLAAELGPHAVEVVEVIRGMK
jgi:tripartite ATP-independent transporter DctP family solute receptor